MPTIESKYWGATPQGDANLYTLRNRGMEVQITNYGAIITSIIVPDKNGKAIDVVLGFDNIDQYLAKHPHFGGLIGRYGNRIAGGKFTIGDEVYELAKNNGPNNLHAGPIGFDKMLHNVETFETDDTVGVIMSRKSPNMESGFPGNLYYKVYYTLDDKGELLITYEATTDRTTHVNLTNHSYFNLNGEGNKSALDTQLMIKAHSILEVDNTLIPLGNLYPVSNTPFDFTQSKTLSQDIDEENTQLALGSGYDHNYVLDTEMGSLELVAVAHALTSGICMEVHTTEPGMQLYTANWLDGTLIGKSGKPYLRRSAFCLETQHYPNTPNNDDFPPTLLKKGEQYQSQTAYKFSIR